MVTGSRFSLRDRKVYEERERFEKQQCSSCLLQPWVLNTQYTPNPPNTHPSEASQWRTFHLPVADNSPFASSAVADNSDAASSAVADNSDGVTIVEDDDETDLEADDEEDSPKPGYPEDDQQDEQEVDEEMDDQQDDQQDKLPLTYWSGNKQWACPEALARERNGTLNVKLMKSIAKRKPAPKPAVAEWRHCPIEAGNRRGPDFKLPHWVGQGNCLLATWVVGRRADPAAVRKKLTKAPYDCCVLMFSKEVWPCDPIAKWISETAKRDQKNIATERPSSFLSRKAIFKVWHGCFIVINRRKVEDCELNHWAASEQNLHCGVYIATVTLRLNAKKQRMKELNLGVVSCCMKAGLSDQDVKDLIQWIIVSKVSVVTGYWGRNPPQLRKIAIEAGAIHNMPACQWMQMPHRWYGRHGLHVRRCGFPVTHPSFFMLFGYYRNFKMTETDSIPAWWRFGDDLEKELIDKHNVPKWPKNQEGNPMVHNLGLIKTKPIDLKKDGCTT